MQDVNKGRTVLGCGGEGVRGHSFYFLFNFSLSIEFTKIKVY